MTHYVRQHLEEGLGNIFSFRAMPRRPRKRKSTYTTTRLSKRRRITSYGTQEVKFLDTTINDAAVTMTGQVSNSFNLIVRGDGDSERIGRKVWIKSIHVRFEYFLPQQTNQADIGVGDQLRIMMIQDKQANGAPSTVLNILETAVKESYRNLANSSRYRVFYDRNVVLNRRVAVTDGTNTSTSPTVIGHFEKYTRINTVPIEFDGATGALSEIRSNNFFMLFISQVGVIGVQNSLVRIRYNG